MTLEVCRRDFESLIKRIELERAFESTDIENRYVIIHVVPQASLFFTSPIITS